MSCQSLHFSSIEHNSPLGSVLWGDSDTSLDSNHPSIQRVLHFKMSNKLELYAVFIHFIEHSLVKGATVQCFIGGKGTSWPQVHTHVAPVTQTSDEDVYNGRISAQLGSTPSLLLYTCVPLPPHSHRCATASHHPSNTWTHWEVFFHLGQFFLSRCFVTALSQCAVPVVKMSRQSHSFQSHAAQ